MAPQKPTRSRFAKSCGLAALVSPSPSVSESSLEYSSKNTSNTTPSSSPIPFDHDIRNLTLSDSRPLNGSRFRDPRFNTRSYRFQRRLKDAKPKSSKALEYPAKRTELRSGSGVLGPADHGVAGKGRSNGRCTCSCHSRRNRRRNTGRRMWIPSHIDNIVPLSHSSPDIGQQLRRLGRQVGESSESAPETREEGQRRVNHGQARRYRTFQRPRVPHSSEDSEDSEAVGAPK